MMLGTIVGGVIGGFAGASSFTANSAYISKYGGNVKEVLSAYKGNPRLKVLNSNTTVYRTWGDLLVRLDIGSHLKIMDLLHEVCYLYHQVILLHIHHNS